MLSRVIDYLKNEHITALFTSLTQGGNAYEQTDVGISSLMDTWLLLQMVQSASERNRILYVLKSRGMAHSNQMREFMLSSEGINLVDVYTGPGAVYTGTARMNQEALDKAQAVLLADEATRKGRQIEQEMAATRAQIAALQTKLSVLEQDSKTAAATEKDRLAVSAQDRAEMARARRND